MLKRMLQNPDREKANRITTAMLKMARIDIAELQQAQRAQRAYNGRQAVAEISLHKQKEIDHELR